MPGSRQVSREEAGRLIRSASRLDPSDREARRKLARFLYATDALEELVEQFEPDLDCAAPDPECLHYLGIAALALGTGRLAEAALSRAVSGGYADSSGPWAGSVFDLGRTSQAYAIAIDALGRDPEDELAAKVAFKVLLAEGRKWELWELCMRLRAGARWTPGLVSALALAAQTPEQLSFADRIVGEDLWLDYRSLGLEPWWLQLLASSLKSSQRWTPLPRTKATVRTGRRIEAVHAEVGNPWLDTLFRRLGTAIAEYIGARKDLLALPADDHPMAAMKPDHLTLTSWVVSVTGDGHENWHIHPDGWLSGVFYVEVPDLASTDAPHAGHIEFGLLPLDSSVPTGARPGRMLEPRTGSLVLFPSYIAHRTWPTGLEEDRICIAFDVLRRGVESMTAGVAPRCESPGVSLDDWVVRNTRALSVPGDDGCPVIMNLDSGHCVAMGDTAALIWSLMQTPQRLRDLVGDMVREFDGEETDIQRDVVEAVGRMVACGLATVR